jgi:2,5-diketo-D-gluconate reductase A
MRSTAMEVEGGRPFGQLQEEEAPTEAPTALEEEAPPEKGMSAEVPSSRSTPLIFAIGATAMFATLALWPPSTLRRPLSASPQPLTLGLSDGRALPRIAFGTGGRDKEQYRAGAAYPAVLDAISIGMRHIDTAAFYGDEAEVGRAVRDSGVSREALWVTSKLAVGPNTLGMGFNETLSALNASLSRLGLTYVDLYLIHSPFDRSRRIEQWRALVHAKQAGLARSIGVSNYGAAHLRELEAEPEQPVVNQIELHPWLQQAPTVAYCRAHGIALEAYGPLGPSANWKDPTLHRIAQARGRPVQQVSQPELSE